jgi:hypothetical protein
MRITNELVYNIVTNDIRSNKKKKFLATPCTVIVPVKVWLLSKLAESSLNKK